LDTIRNLNLEQAPAQKFGLTDQISVLGANAWNFLLKRSGLTFINFFSKPTGSPVEAFGKNHSAAVPTCAGVLSLQ